jgi:hypothetical protein
MAFIKEPVGVDLTVEPMPLSEEDKKALSDAIAQYKQTGKVPKIKDRPKKIKPSDEKKNKSEKVKAKVKETAGASK